MSQLDNYKTSIYVHIVIIYLFIMNIMFGN